MRVCSSKMPPVFRETPPKDLLDVILKPFGITSIHDATPFTQSNLKLEEFEEALPQLEPFYLPCKAKDYIHKSPFTPACAITILRQMLKAHSLKLKTSEKTRGGQKMTWYQIQYNTKSVINQESKEEITIAFE